MKHTEDFKRYFKTTALKRPHLLSVNSLCVGENQNHLVTHR